jgi:hypothetical protein
VISHSVFWTSLRPLSYCNGSKEPKISKQAAAGTIRVKTLTFPETTEIIMKLGNATECHYGSIKDF